MTSVPTARVSKVGYLPCRWNKLPAITREFGHACPRPVLGSHLHLLLGQDGALTAPAGTDRAACGGRHGQPGDRPRTWLHHRHGLAPPGASPKLAGFSLLRM